MRQYIPAIRWVQQLLDLVMVQALLYGFLHWRLHGDFSDPFLTTAVISTLLMILIYQWQRVYHHFRAENIWSQGGALLRAWFTVLLAIGVLLFITGTTNRFPRSVLLGWAISGAVAQLFVHLVVGRINTLLRTRGFNRRRALLVGDEHRAREFAERLRNTPWLGIEALGVVTLGPKATKPLTGPALPHLGTAERLEQVLSEVPVDLVYLTVPLKDSPRIEEFMLLLMPRHVDVHWVPDVSTLELLNHGAYDMDGQPVLSLSDSPLAGTRRMVKWCEDKLIAATILLLTSPLLLLIALAVKLTSPGPVLFKQKRAGLKGEQIVIYKFRSMRDHQEPHGRLTQAVRKDPRLTPIGAFLRRTSLDELPQFLNVLQGRMSVVGPRPHALEHDSYYVKEIRAYMLRHSVKPGITGWAQVNHWRGETDTPEKMRIRIKYDLYYINNWSLSFDLLIILMTLWQMVGGRNAY